MKWYQRLAVDTKVCHRRRYYRIFPIRDYSAIGHFGHH
jgi:hypothetical protein